MVVFKQQRHVRCLSCSTRLKLNVSDIIAINTGVALRAQLPFSTIPTDKKIIMCKASVVHYKLLQLSLKRELEYKTKKPILSTFLNI
jgi:hypothetical protein